MARTQILVHWGGGGGGENNDSGAVFQSLVSSLAHVS